MSAEDLALRTFDSVLLAESQGVKEPVHVARGMEAFDYLSRGFFEIDSSSLSFDAAKISDLQQRWELHWFNDEAVSELFKRISDYSDDPTKLHYELALKQLNDVFLVVGDHLMLIVDDLCTGESGGLMTRHVRHSPEEIDVFEQIREAYYSGIQSSHFNYVKRITDYVEVRIRAFLYATCILVFGERYEDQIPEQFRKYAYRNLGSRRSYSPFENAFTGLTRPQFRGVFLEGNKIKDMIVDQMKCGWMSEDWRKFIETFAEENIATAHQQVQAYSPLDRTRYLHYCRMAEQFTAAINSMMSQLLITNLFMFHCGQDRSNPEDYIFKCAFKGLARIDESPGRVLSEMPSALKRSSQADLTLKRESYRRVKDLLGHKVQGVQHGCLVEDLLDIEYLMNNYSVRYEEFILSLSFGHFVDKTIIVYPWFGSSVLIKARQKVR